MQEKDFKNTSEGFHQTQPASKPAPKPSVAGSTTVPATGGDVLVMPISNSTAQKPSDAILLGIESFMATNLPIAQKSIVSTSEDSEGRERAVSLIKRLMAEIVNWLQFEEAVSVAEELFSECQTKSGAKHNVSLSHQLLRLQEEFHAGRNEISKKIEQHEYEKDVTNKEIAGIISNFKGFSENFHKRRNTDKREAAGEQVQAKKDLEGTFEQMKQNQERLRDEIEIEITYEEGRRKELENRHAQFIKTLDFQIATRIVNLKLNLDQPEVPQYPGQNQEKACRRCEERQNLEMADEYQDGGGQVYATVRRSGMGSPTRFKGKRESMPTMPAGPSQLQLMRPANQQQMGITQPSFRQGANKMGGGGGAYDDDFNTMVVLQPGVSSCELRAKIQFTRFLSNGLLLLVPKGLQDNSIILIHTQLMRVVKEHTNEFQVNCAAGCTDYYFVGLENNRILVFSTHSHDLVKTLLTRRAPISMTIVDKRLCVVGLRQHAYTSINFLNDFKQHGMTWNQGNDWVQVHTNQENNGFYRVWQKENMTFATLAQFGNGADFRKVDFQWQNDHVVACDMQILGEIDSDNLLYYSFDDKQLLLYSKRKMSSNFVRMTISPIPKSLLECDKPLDGIKTLALHPKFYHPGNTFVVIVDLNNQVNVCKARFDSSSKGDPSSVFTLPRIVPGFNKFEVLSTSDNGLVTYQVTKDPNQMPIVKKLEFARDQLQQMLT